MNRELPKEWEVWKHFKGVDYTIICIGHHSETKEKMVVYAKTKYIRLGDADVDISWEGEPCIRPLEMFMSEVDHEKYPNISQKYRFERVEK